MSSPGAISYENGFESVYEADEDEDGDDLGTEAGVTDADEGDATSVALGLAIELGKNRRHGKPQHPRHSRPPLQSANPSNRPFSARLSSQVQGPPVTFQKMPLVPLDTPDASEPIVGSSDGREQSKKPSGLSMLLNPGQKFANSIDTSANGQTIHTELSTMGALVNPFIGYASVSPPTNSANPSLTLEIYFAFSDDPSESIKVQVRKEITVEELIGWSLYQYVDRGRKPGLEVPPQNDTSDNLDALDPRVWLTTSGWALRMVEDDGEVDEDFPALDREGRVEKFTFGAFAIVRATRTQIEQNLVKNPLKPLPGRQGTQTGGPNDLLMPTPSLGGPADSTMHTNAHSMPSTMATPTPRPFAPSSTLTANNKMYRGPLSTSVANASIGGVMITLKVRVIAASNVQHTTSLNV